MMRMRTTRALALGGLVTGLVMVTAGIACSGSGDDDDDQSTQEPTSTATATATATSTPSPTPTPTPTPFDGKVARMTIPELGVDHPIEEIGINTVKNELETPKDATGAVGWYHIYDKPGWGKNSLYSAHVNYNGRNGPFARLNKAVPDQTQITVQMADGPAYTYVVSATCVTPSTTSPWATSSPSPPNRQARNGSRSSPALAPRACAGPRRRRLR
jgi:hypothetical protein